MSNVDDIRKALQDFLAPELAAIRENLTAQDKVAEARYQSAQSQYAAMQTHMELILKTVQLAFDAIKSLDAKVDTLIHEKAGTR